MIGRYVIGVGIFVIAYSIANATGYGLNIWNRVWQSQTLPIGVAIILVGGALSVIGL